MLHMCRRRTYSTWYLAQLRSYQQTLSSIRKRWRSAVQGSRMGKSGRRSSLLGEPSEISMQTMDGRLSRCLAPGVTICRSRAPDAPSSVASVDYAGCRRVYEWQHDVVLSIDGR